MVGKAQARVFLGVDSKGLIDGLKKSANFFKEWSTSITAGLQLAKTAWNVVFGTIHKVIDKVEKYVKEIGRAHV